MASDRDYDDGKLNRKSAPREAYHNNVDFTSSHSAPAVSRAITPCGIPVRLATIVVSSINLSAPNSRTKRAGEGCDAVCDNLAVDHVVVKLYTCKLDLKGMRRNHSF